MKNFLNPKVKEVFKTTGEHHFFGYYDICPWDEKGEKILAHEVDFIDRMPTGKEPARIGYFTEKEEFKKLAETYAWNFQQGARLQWLPSAADTIIYNDYASNNGRFVSVILNIKTGEKRILPHPIYAVHSNGEFALTLNFFRLQKHGGYGYQCPEVRLLKEVGLPKVDDPFPEDDGIFQVNLKTGESKLILSIAGVANFKNPQKITSPHHLTMILFNHSGDRFAFLERYKLPDGGIHTRLLTANPDGTDLFLLAEGTLSHFDWFSDNEILIWGRRKSVLTDLRKRNFFNFPILKPFLNFIRKKERGFLRHHIIGDQLLLFKDKKGYIGSIGVGSITEDGHFSRYKNTEWILGDNYPNREHYRDLFLFNLKQNKKIPIGRFYSLPDEKYNVKADWDLSAMRSDLHPRWNRDGTQICFDSVHEGSRQIHVLDIENLINEYGKN